MSNTEPSKLRTLGEVVLLVLLFFAYAGDPPPNVNEAHYLVKAKNFWQPDWCRNDLFASSGKAHTTFYLVFGWPTQFTSLQATTWIGRFVGWLLLAIGLQRLSSRLIPYRFGSLGVAAIWLAGIEYGDLAGEWVVGGIEAKVPAYGFVLMALAQLVNRRWLYVWPLLGVASAFHVLTGGWSVVAAMLVWLVTESKRDDRYPFFSRSLFLGGAIALLGLLPAIWLTRGVSDEDAALAARIYTYFRLKHHLLPANLLTIWYIRHAILIGSTFAGLLSFRGSADDESRQWRRLAWFTTGAIGIACVGLAIGMLPSYAPDLAAKLLRYYWFRMTDAVVPLSLGLIAMRFICQPKTLRGVAGVVLLLTAIALITNSSFRRARLGVPPSASNELLGWDADASAQEQQKVFRDWLSVCQWVRNATPKDEIFLTPRHQQTFKWYAHRAEVVNWKDVPQDAVTLKTWYERFGDVFPFWRGNARLGSIRVTIRYADLQRYRQQYGVRFMIVDRRITGPNLPLAKVYPLQDDTNLTYAVYELPY